MPELGDAVVETLQRAAVAAFQALALRDYARFDFRLAPDGTAFLIEANPNPNLAQDEDFAQSARAAGVKYADLLEKLLALGAGYQAEWRAYYG